MPIQAPRPMVVPNQPNPAEAYIQQIWQMMYRKKEKERQERLYNERLKQKYDWETERIKGDRGFSLEIEKQREVRLQARENDRIKKAELLLKAKSEKEKTKTTLGEAYTNKEGKRARPVFDYQNKFIRDEVLGNEKIETPDNFKKAKQLREKFITGSKDFVKVRDSYGRIIASAKDPSAAGDLALIFNYMKVLDPGSVVRESEFATAAASGAFGERLKAAGMKVLRGERLSDAMRKDFVGRAGKLFMSQRRFHLQNREEYERIAKLNKVDPENVIVNYLSSPSLYQEPVKNTIYVD